MSNLIVNTKEDQEIVLTQFETAQGWKVKIDLKTNNIWVTTKDLESLLGMPETTLKPDRLSGGKVTELLRNDGLSELRKDLKISHNSGRANRGQCYDEDQLFCILEGFNPPMYKASKKFGVKTAILRSCGLLEIPKPIQLTAAQHLVLLQPYVELAALNPGLEQLAQHVNTITCLILTDKPFTLRFWIQIHFSGYNLSRQALTRFGRQVAATYQQHQLKLPINGYTALANKYTTTNHDLICQVFQTMLDAGQLD